MKKSIFFLLLFAIATSHAQIRLPKLISDGMVLQRDEPVSIWGWASAGEVVQVSFNGQQFQTTTDASGKWTIVLPAQKAGGPYTLQLKASNSITLKDILFGDVWVCGGQSNMELWMGRMKYKYADAIQQSTYPEIRQFIVPDTYHFKAEQDDVASGTWQASDPQHVLEFSGVGYFFAKELYTKYHVPIGLINTALGGSPAESWISSASIKKFPDLWAEAEKFKDDRSIQQVEKEDQVRSDAWYQYTNVYDKGHTKQWLQSDINDPAWQPVTVPGYWADQGLGASNGVVWYAKEFTAPAAMVGKAIKVELGRIVDADSVFLNGQFIGGTTYQYPPRRYEVGAGLLKEGVNRLMVRLINNAGKGGFVLDKRYEITTGTDTISLAGVWKFRRGIDAVALPSPTFIRWKPTGLYNAMIAPLKQYGVKGVIWYQGESNTGNPSSYAALMQTVISDWRMQWNKPQLPFFYVQLANFMETKTQPDESQWAALRQQQLNGLSVPHTGMAVAIDLGDWNDIHPERKEEIGYRLSLLARKNVYGETKLIASGPMPQSVKRMGSDLIVTFDQVGKGLKSIDSKPLRYFEVAGADHRFYWAEARIEKNAVRFHSKEVVDPVYVRYAWSDNPGVVNFYNEAGLPGTPFEKGIQ